MLETFKQLSKEEQCILVEILLKSLHNKMPSDEKRNIE